jgi:hypothetical protein
MVSPFLVGLPPLALSVHRDSAAAPPGFQGNSTQWCQRDQATRTLRSAAAGLTCFTSSSNVARSIVNFMSLPVVSRRRARYPFIAGQRRTKTVSHFFQVSG